MAEVYKVTALGLLNLGSVASDDRQNKELINRKKKSKKKKKCKLNREREKMG